MRLLPLVLLLTALPLAVADSPGPETSVPALKRIAVIGASVSDGFLLPNEVHAMVTLADVARASVKLNTQMPFRKSSMLFFRDPVEYGTRYAKAAQAHDPSLLIAIDFLFWFGYGFTVDEEDRLQGLERGLALLEPFECPVLIGDFPDMRVAAQKGVGIHGAPMISEWQVPQKETLEKLNARLLEWSGSRSNVHLVPMSSLLEKIRGDQSIEIRGNVWPEGSMTTLIDQDLLHTTLEGTISLTLLALDVLAREDAEVPDDAFVWDKEIIRERVLKAREIERRQRMGTTATSAGQTPNKEEEDGE